MTNPFEEESDAAKDALGLGENEKRLGQYPDYRARMAVAEIPQFPRARCEDRR